MKNQSIFNTENVTNITRSKGKSTDCLYCDATLNEQTAKVIYDLTEKVVAIFGGNVTKHETCDAIMDNIGAYLDTINLADLPDYDISDLMSNW